MLKNRLAASAALLVLAGATSAQAASDADIEALRAEIQQMKQLYENRIEQLEKKLATVENTAQVQPTVQNQPSASATTTRNPAPPTPATVRRDIFDSRFNPSIGVILNGQYSNFSSDDGDIAGFAVGHDGERPREGFAIDHTELNFSANVDDKFFGTLTAAIAEHEGETELELEEAFVQTLPGMGLPSGMSIRAGRAFWILGYLNEHHNHTDDFADRPLPYRVFLNDAYNDDGAEVSYVLPTELYTEIGGGVFRGDDFPYGESDGEGIDAWSAYARIGGDIGDRQSWRLGLSTLQGEAGERDSNEHELEYIGDTDLYVADIRYTFAPTGNARQRELILQGEYFWRDEDGAYEDKDAGTGLVNFDDSTSGWYAQTVYKFHPQWRVGARYSQLEAPDVPAGLVGSKLDANGHDPRAYAAMVDWTNSEFSRLRLQYNREELADNQDDNQIMLQYIMSIGAHGAHRY